MKFFMIATIEKIEKACEYCGEKYEPIRSSQKFCSKKCGSANHYQKNKEKRKEKDKIYRENNKEKITLSGKIKIGDKEAESEASDKNLFFALNKILADLTSKIK